MNDFAQFKEQIKKAYVLGFKNQMKVLGANKSDVATFSKTASAHFDAVDKKSMQKVASCKEAIREIISDLKKAR